MGAVMSEQAKILVIDNYDSFVYTIVGYLKTLGADVTVYRNDALSDAEISAAVKAADGVLISPGPGTPQEAGCSEDVIRECAAQSKPMLGVCLGLQALAEVYGATVDHAPTIMHGKTSLIDHVDGGLFEGVPNPMTATRYHSLAVEPSTMPAELEVIAQTQDHIIQGIKHRTLPLYSVQFHPESVMTQGGYRLFANWLAMCGQSNAIEKSAGLVPNVSKVAAEAL
jgi:para-aminobenzoate synthetase component 2